MQLLHNYLLYKSEPGWAGGMCRGALLSPIFSHVNQMTPHQPPLEKMARPKSCGDACQFTACLPSLLPTELIDLSQYFVYHSKALPPDSTTSTREKQDSATADDAPVHFDRSPAVSSSCQWGKSQMWRMILGCTPWIARACWQQVGVLVFTFFFGFCSKGINYVICRGQPQ